MPTVDFSKYKAIILDLDGIITHTMRLHQEAWKKMFDNFLEKQKGQRDFSEQDYMEYVDGKPRYEGVRSFLTSRDIHLEEGNENDSEQENTIYGLGNWKNKLFLSLLETNGAEVYEDTLACIDQWKKEEKKLAVVSSSKNCRYVLESAGLIHSFEVIVDGTDAKKKGLKGKPDPDIFLEAAQKLEIAPQEAVIFEDAVAGVKAGKAGGFGYVVGVDRNDHAEEMKAAGADLIIKTLNDLS